MEAADTTTDPGRGAGSQPPPTPTAATPPPPPQPPAAGDQETPTAKVFSQAEVDALLGKARNQASSAAKKELADTLGVPFDEAKKILDQRQADELAQMTEAQRLTAEASTARAEAEKALADAQRESLRARITTALNTGDMTTGVLPIRSDRVALAADLAVSRALAAPEGEDPISHGIGFVRESSPEWFGPTQAGQTTTQKPSTPPPPGRTGAEAGGAGPAGSDIASRFEAFKAKNKRPDVLKTKS